MTVAFNALHEVHLGYAAIFLCIGFGFLFLKKIYGGGTGPGYWAAGFFSNALGFLFWSGFMPLRPSAYYLIGETFHISGFFLLVYGALKFSRVQNLKRGSVIFCAVWGVFWGASIVLMRRFPFAAGVSLKLLRAILFMISGTILLIKKDEEEPIGKNIAGASLLIWACYTILSAFVKMNGNIFFGLLIGFQVLAAFGMVAMVIDRIRVESEKNAEHAKTLEGILPICSYCKKIRDEKNNWRVLEEYVEDRSKAEFSHGICPDCYNKYRPDK